MRLKVRQGMIEKTSDALTDPSFENVTTKTDDSGRFRVIEAKIYETGKPLVVDIQKTGDVEYRFSVRQGKTYSGTVSLSEDCDVVFTLDRLDERRVIPRGRKNTPMIKTPEGWQEVPQDGRRAVSYWLPTVISHIARNADNFGRFQPEEQTETTISQTDAIRDGPTNHFSIVYDPNNKRKSPQPHIRASTVSRREIDGKRVEVRVSGSYVATDWNKYTTEEVVDSFQGKAAENISIIHFQDVVLPRMVRAGHPRQELFGAFLAAKDAVSIEE